MASPNGNTTQLQDLLHQAAQGDSGAYDELITHASDRLLRLTRKMLRNYPQLRRWEQTDDVFQNAAIRLHRSLHNVQPESVRAFFGLAALEIRRSLIDLIRHHFGPEGAAAKHQTDPGNDSTNDGTRLQQIADPQDTPEAIQAWAEFHDAVDQLPDDEREVFQLIWYAGLQQQEIASLLEVSIPTVQRRLYRARHRIRESLPGRQPPAQEEP